MNSIRFTTLFPVLTLLLLGYLYPADAAGSPGIALEERLFAAGEVQEGEVIEHIFTFTNEGDKILNINVKPD
jgi:hypothetical protein